MAKFWKDESKDERLSRRERTEKLFKQPDLLDTILGDIASGGNLVEMARTWEIKYSDLFNWLRRQKVGEKDGMALFMEAVKARGEYAIEDVGHELHLLSKANLADVFNDDGTVKPISLWPEEVKASLQSLDIDELFDGEGKEKFQAGITKKIKLVSKLQAIELRGKLHGAFVQKHEHKVSEGTYESYLSGSYKEGDPIQ